MSQSREFQRRFSGYYRVRRGEPWRRHFFGLLQEQKTARRPFEQVLRELHQRTDRVEASFASKLVATVEPDLPVIDYVVLMNLDVSLPLRTDPDRLNRIVTRYANITRAYHTFLACETGRYLVEQFQNRYPGYSPTEVKMLDLVLWQHR